MTILHVIPALNPAQGGLLSTLAGLCLAWHKAGGRCEVAALETSAPPAVLEHAEVKLFAPGRPRRLAASPAMKAWLAQNTARFDAIFTQGLWLSPTRYAFNAAQSAQRPFFLLPAGMLDPDALAHHRFRKAVRWWLGEGGMVRRANILFSTEEDRARAMNHLGLEPERCHILANPVQDVWFDMAPPVPDELPRIACLNRLHPRKGVLELVQALSLLHGRGVAFHATVAGPEEDRAYVARCREAGAALERAGRLRWPGLLDGAGTRALVAASDVVVHPAVGFENFGMVIAEALAAGRVVMASRRALVTPQLERAGLVEAVEPQPESLAAGLSRLLERRSQWPELAARARIYAREHFGAEAVGRRLIALLGSS